MNDLTVTIDTLTTQLAYLTYNVCLMTRSCSMFYNHLFFAIGFYVRVRILEAKPSIFWELLVLSITPKPILAVLVITFTLLHHSPIFFIRRV